MMFSFKAIITDRTDNSEYHLEHPEGDRWHLYHNDRELALAGDPQMYRDGGTIEADFVSESNEGQSRVANSHPDTLIIPQQLFPQKELRRPTLNGRSLELTEWWIGGRRHLNGAAL